MQRNILVFICFFIWVNAEAQRCATHDLHQHKMQTDESYKTSYLQTEQLAHQWRISYHDDGQRALLLTIPVVVHVLYKDSSQNISDLQIQSQLDVLNRDYRALNPITLPPYFDSLKADIEVEFCLASVDPNGNPTNGITRTATTGGQLFGYFSPFGEDAKSDATGGKNPWPTNEYLNLWVCDLFPGLLGYAQFPGGIDSTDGVVITTRSFGTVGNIDPLSPGGRTAVHEIGHWFGLRHIWGDDSDCTGSDSIPDTPNSSAASQQDCNTSLNSCNNEDPYWGVFDPTDMVQNYMDYSNDTCMGMFSKGQKQRMHSFLYSDPARFALFTSPAGCSFLGVEEAQQLHVSVFPNPANDVVYLKWSENLICNLSILQVNGQVVRSYQNQSSGSSINISDLSAGIYLIQLRTAQGIIKTTKLLVQ